MSDGDRLDVRRAAREAPHRPALVADDGTWTFGALARRVEGAMAALLDRGVRPGADVLVALPGERDPHTLIAVYALMNLGVPFTPVHPRLSGEERAGLLRRLAPTWELGPREVVALAGAPAPAVPVPTDAPDPAGPLAVVSTSGSAGEPKGAVLSRRAFLAAADASAANLGWRPDDRWLLALPLAHLGGLSIPVRALLARRAVVCGPSGPFDADAMVDAVARHRVTLASLVPTMLTRLLDRVPAWCPPPSLRAILLGGAGAAETLLERSRRRGLPVLATYGLTETCGQVATQPAGTPPGPEQGAGRPLPGMDVRIVDGEIRIRSASLLDGYRGADAAPALTADGFLRTGDAGRFDGEGRLHVLGRLDDRIITGGENVDPLEVERVLEGIAGVRAACVFGVPDPAWGELVAAALVLAGDGPGPETLREELRRRLAPHRRPRRWAPLPSLPTTPSGKVDRRAVARQTGSCLRPL